jgi:peptidoglycan-N-acetylglucosamine deacetylase
MRATGQNARVSLTFDDGPDEVWTPRVMRELERHAVPATFFVIAPRARREKRTIADLVDAGHAVELHCDRHVRHTTLTADELRRDTERGLEMLARLGIVATRWRTPCGERSAATDSVAREFGLELVGWTADTHDWRGDPAEHMWSRLRPVLKPDAVILMHDGRGPDAQRRGCPETVRMIDLIAHEVALRGWQIGPLAPVGDHVTVRS